MRVIDVGDSERIIQFTPMEFKSALINAAIAAGKLTAAEHDAPWDFTYVLSNKDTPYQLSVYLAVKAK